MTCWYTATTPPQGEARAARHLTRRGIQHLILHLVERVGRRGRAAPQRRPAFPRYIFTAGTPAHITATPGISGLVTVAGRPATLTQHAIDSLVARTDGRGCLRAPARPASAPQFKSGDCVRISDGPMTGFQGIVVSSSAGIAVVRLGTLGHITVPEHLLGAGRNQVRHRPRRRTERTPRSNWALAHATLQAAIEAAAEAHAPQGAVDVLRSTELHST